MTTILYSAIFLAPGKRHSDVIRRAQECGYTPVLFAGWTDADLGRKFGPHKGPRRDEAQANLTALKAVNDILTESGIGGFVDTYPIPDGFVVA